MERLRLLPIIPMRLAAMEPQLAGSPGETYPCVIISGRARSDVLDKLRGVKVARVIGNHGAEMG